VRKRFSEGVAEVIWRFQSVHRANVLMHQAISPYNAAVPANINSRPKSRTALRRQTSHQFELDAALRRLFASQTTQKQIAVDFELLLPLAKPQKAKLFAINCGQQQFFAMREDTNKNFESRPDFTYICY